MGTHLPSEKEGETVAPTFRSVYQTAKWIKMPLSTEVGLGPDHIVLDEDQAPLPPKNGQSPPVFGSCLLWPNRWTDQDETWYGCMPRSRRHCVRWRPISPKKGGQQPPNFWAHVLWPNGWMDQDTTWYRGRPRPRRHCVRWAPSPPPNGAQPLNCWPMSVVAK